MQNLDLKAEERSAFRGTVDTGLWDVFIASYVAMFAVAPLLSVRLGDFWTAAVFLPVWVAAYLAIRLIEQRVVVPRVGRVRWGEYRKTRLRRFTMAMLTVNIVALLLGIVAFAFAIERGADGLWLFPLMFSAIVLAGFSLAAHFLNIPRLFLYGLLLAVGALIGEMLFRGGLVSHHGYPVVFGIAAVVIAAIGLIKFALLLRGTRPIEGEQASLANNG